MVRDDLLYTKEHEWIKADGDVGIVGITDYAQSELGDIVFIELPAAKKSIAAGEAFATIEAVKAVSDVYAPVSGEIIEVNEALRTAPDIVNNDPYGDGWMVKIKMSDRSELDNLLSPQDYKDLIGE
ncbi:glycine cleavage system protein GcvH [bacterium]|nr:glycine cleavage system protein GcvH [bacterium]